ncbi:MAG: DUF421 domain-containing protein [Solirubrobacterales bacterium]
MPVWLTVLLRGLAVFLILFAATRLDRARGAQLTRLELLMATATGAIAGGVALGAIPLGPGSLILAAWLLVGMLIRFASLKAKGLREFFYGPETVLINRGKVLEDNLMQTHLTPEDLAYLLRRKNIFNFADVEFAVLETDGSLSALVKNDRQPVTPAVLNLKLPNQAVPQTIVLDGNIMNEPLTALGLNRDWILTELNKAGAALENVFIAQVDGSGQLYLDLFDDLIELPQPKTRQLLWSTLRKCQADSELYALGTKNLQAKQDYAETARILQGVLDELEPVLTR